MIEEPSNAIYFYFDRFNDLKIIQEMESLIRAINSGKDVYICHIEDILF